MTADKVVNQGFILSVMKYSLLGPNILKPFIFHFPLRVTKDSYQYKAACRIDICPYILICIVLQTQKYSELNDNMHFLSLFCSC